MLNDKIRNHIDTIRNIESGIGALQRDMAIANVLANGEFSKEGVELRRKIDTRITELNTRRYKALIELDEMLKGAE